MHRKNAALFFFFFFFCGFFSGAEVSPVECELSSCEFSHVCSLAGKLGCKLAAAGPGKGKKDPPTFFL